MYPNKVNVYYTGEPRTTDMKFDIIIDYNEGENHFLHPFFMYFLFMDNEPRLSLIINRPLRMTVPQKFCCFIVSNPTCPERAKIFHMLSKYKRVDSYGRFLNNMGGNLSQSWGSKEFLDIIGQYKFVITFENSKKGYYITEKIFHGYLNRIIPIYWGSSDVGRYFNTDSMVYLQDYEKDVEKAVERIIELDNDDQKWLACANQNPFSCDMEKVFEEDCETFSDMVKRSIKH